MTNKAPFLRQHKVTISVPAWLIFFGCGDYFVQHTHVASRGVIMMSVMIVESTANKKENANKII